jgi:synaptosomal-associated protein 29
MVTELQPAFCYYTTNILFSNVQELSCQRRVLEQSERRLDEINNTLRFSQKHIQGIKVKFN